MKEKTWLRIIVDVHGHAWKHLELIKDVPYSLQLGDLGFQYDYLLGHKVDPERHKFFGGNHDNYDVIAEYPHNLGDFGIWSIPEFGDIFFVRGAFSIDAKYRDKFGPKKSWWVEEELTYPRLEEAIELYKQVKPKILITHECPLNIVKHVTNPAFALSFGFPDPIIKTRTNQALQAMVDAHQPALLLFGHFHRNFDQWVNLVTGEVESVAIPDGENTKSLTRCICRNEFGYTDLPKDFLVNLP